MTDVAANGNARVEGIWQQLSQQHSQSRHKAAADRLVGSLATSDACVRSGGGRGRIDTATKQRLCVQQLGVSGSTVARGTSCTHSTSDTRTPLLATPAELSKATLDRLLLSLQSQDGRVVRTAVQHIEVRAGRGDAGSHAVQDGSQNMAFKHTAPAAAPHA
jgi:hypothetical protein